MHQYEITYLLDAQLDEKGRGELDASIDAKIAELEGSTSFSSPNLRRRLAYLIDKKNSAFIRTLQIELDPAKITTIHALLKKDPMVIRFSILQTGRREDATQEIMERYTRKRDSKTASVTTRKAAPVVEKEVTDEAVEKGIEEALTAEVK